MARYKDAVEPLKRVCGADDELTQNASYHLGDCYLRMGNKSSAADAFAMASTGGYDENIARESLLNYGRLKYELGGGIFNEAINVLQEYLVRYPHSEHAPEVKRLLVAAYYNSKDYDAAYKGIREIPNPDDEIRSALQKVAVFRAVKAIGEKRWEEAEALLTFPGFMLGIGGALTYKKSTLPAVLAGAVPLNRIVLETDSPYLAPVPHRGKRNESKWMWHVVERLAEVYQCSVNHVNEVTTANAKRLFIIKL
jgi:tetratricopeptide (TPR) repeat protein